jgi:hypothetical protein
MRKINLFRIFVAFTVVLFASCSTESIDPVLTESIDNGGEDGGGTDNGGGNNGGGDNGGGTSSGDYWPMAINNEWQYESSEPQNDQPMKIVSSETINGKQYYKMNRAFQESGNQQMSGTATIHLRKESGSYFQRTSLAIPNQNGMSITASPFEILILKDNLEVNGTWTGNAQQNFTYSMPGMPAMTTDIDYKGTIMQNGITFTVNGENYTNVIKIKYEQDIAILMGSTEVAPPVHTETYIWFAKDIGPIRSETVATSGLPAYYMDLVSYTLH